MSQIKRITFENSRGQTLVGHLYHTTLDRIVLMAPGFCSDKSSLGRFDIFARRFNNAGISALSIDFSGCGESDDDTLTVDKQVDDLHSAQNWIQTEGYKNIGLYGNSLGALICLRNYSSIIKTIAMTGGLTGPIQFDWSQYFSPEQMQELHEKGYITERNARNMDRTEVVIDKQLLHDFSEVDQEKVLRNVKCPVLLIHGDGDGEERLIYGLSQRGMKYLPSTSILQVIPGATHAFWGYIDEISELLTFWFLEKL